MIVVCPETRVAEEFHRRISGERVTGTVKSFMKTANCFLELRKQRREYVNTFRIDSKRLIEEGSDAESPPKDCEAPLEKKGQPG